jgi:uncharacterized protein (TIGR00297 family)
MTSYSWISLDFSRNDLTFLGMALALLFALILLSELIRKYLRWTGEVTRKIVHTGTGLLIFFACHELEFGTPLIVIGVIFTVFNFLCVQFNWFAGMHSTDRHTFGTVYYPLAFTVLVLVAWDSHRFIIAGAMLVLAVGDALAALVGKKARIRHVYFLSSDKKTMEGSAAMFLSSWLALLMTFIYFDFSPDSRVSVVIISFLISIIATVVEAISSKGSDNLTLPLSVAWILYLFAISGSLQSEQMIWGIILSFITALTSYYFRFLSLSGSAGAFLLGLVIFGTGGWMWTVPILVFFISSSLLSKTGRQQKKSSHLIFEKGSIRDLGQVIANGGIPGLIVILNGFFPADYWYVVYCGVIAAVTGDTWSTEIGTMFRGKPRSILTFARVEIGTSGGVSVAGTTGGLIGAALIAFSGWLIHPSWSFSANEWLLPVLITVAGVTGSLCDSLLGATLQSQYRCGQCGKITEKMIHCGQESALIRGLTFFHNDRVNLFCGLAGGLLIWIVFRIKLFY